MRIPSCPLAPRPRRLAGRASRLAALAAWLLVCAQLSAATKTWIGNAAAVPSIQTITVTGTWVDADTATLTINGKSIVVTCVGAESTANVATAIKEAWMSVSRLDGTGTTDATSNAGGAAFGEFREMTATVSGSVVTLVAVTAGKPITIAVSDTAAAGAVALATVQTATGPNYWDNAKNWDTLTVPANDDTVVFRDSNVNCCYGLPNAALEVTIQQYMSFTGQIGLPVINRDDPGYPYYEYRQRYVRLDDSGTGTNIAHRFGLGKDGGGSPLINVKHTVLKCSPIVYATGNPRDATSKALNICCTANTSILNILGGSVDFSSQDGGTSAFLSVTQTAGDSRGIEAITAGASLAVSGGTTTIGQAGTLNNVLVRGGKLRLENQTGTIATIGIYPGAVLEYASAATITTLGLNGGTFDARSDAGAFSVGTCTLNAGSKYLDPYGRTTVTGNMFLYFEPSPDLQFGAAAGSVINIVP